MKKHKNGDYVMYEPEQDIKFHRSYKERYEVLKEGLDNEYIDKREAIELFNFPILNIDEQEKEKYLKKLKEL